MTAPRQVMQVGALANVVGMVDVLREERDFARTERDAYANELALTEQDLRHALIRISELCEQLEALKAGLV